MIEQLIQIRDTLKNIAIELERAEFAQETRSLYRIRAIGRLKMTIMDIDVAVESLKAQDNTK